MHCAYICALYAVSAPLIIASTKHFVLNGSRLPAVVDEDLCTTSHVVQRVYKEEIRRTSQLHRSVLQIWLATVAVVPKKVAEPGGVEKNIFPVQFERVLVFNDTSHIQHKSCS